MGSWDETCGISNMPITPGDRCRILFLVEQSPMPPGGFSYASGAWSPLMLPIAGTYEDYGDFKADAKDPTHTPKMAALGDILKEGKCNVPASKLADVLRKQSPWDEPEKNLTLAWPYKGRIGLVFLRDDVYQDLLGISCDAWYGTSSRETFWADIHAWAVESAAYDLTAAEDRADQARKVDKTTLVKGSPEDLARLRDRLCVWNFERFEDWEEKSRLFRLMKESMRGGYPLLLDLRMQLAEKKIDVESGMPILNDLADFMLICSIMGHTRRFWSPQSGKGSQDTFLDLHKALWASFTKRADEMRKKWDE